MIDMLLPCSNIDDTLNRLAASGWTVTCSQTGMLCQHAVLQRTGGSAAHDSAQRLLLLMSWRPQTSLLQL